jgi:hypothetical protein
VSAHTIKFLQSRATTQALTPAKVALITCRILCQLIACQYLLLPIVVSCASTLLANTCSSLYVVESHASILLANTRSPYSCILCQHIACQFPLLSIVASCASALLANTHSTQLPRLMPVGCLPYPCPPQFSNHLLARYLTTGRTQPCLFTLLVSIAPFQSQVLLSVLTLLG